MKLQMTEFEICQEYRLAKDQKNMIGILADQNVTQKEDIIEILIRGGEINPGMQKRKKPYPNGLEEMVDKVSRKELTIAEASHRLGITENKFRYCRGRLLHERAENDLITEAAKNVAAGR